MATKKRVKKTKPSNDYKSALHNLGNLIDEMGRLLYKAQKNGDKIAMWTLTFIYDDLIKLHNRLGNTRLTVKGDQS